MNIWTQNLSLWYRISLPTTDILLNKPKCPFFISSKQIISCWQHLALYFRNDNIIWKNDNNPNSTLLQGLKIKKIYKFVQQC